MRHILANPAILENMPDTGELVFIEEGTDIESEQVENKEAILVHVTRKYELGKKVA